MKYKLKRSLSILIALVMVIGLLPTVTFAASEMTHIVYIFETGMTESTKMDSSNPTIFDNDGNGRADFDSSTGVLTLTNFDCRAIDVNIEKDIIINLVGKNTITGGALMNNFVVGAIISEKGGAITIQGSGTLIIKKKDNIIRGIRTGSRENNTNNGEIVIKGNATVDMSGVHVAVEARNNISIEENASFHAMLETGYTVTKADQIVGLKITNHAPDDSAITINTTGDVTIDNSLCATNFCTYPIYNERNMAINGTQDNYAYIQNVGSLKLKYNVKRASTPSFAMIKITDNTNNNNYAKRHIYEQSPYDTTRFTGTSYITRANNGKKNLAVSAGKDRTNTYEYAVGESAEIRAYVTMSDDVLTTPVFMGWCVYDIEGSDSKYIPGLTPMTPSENPARFSIGTSQYSIISMYNGFTSQPRWKLNPDGKSGHIVDWQMISDYASDRVSIVPVDEYGQPRFTDYTDFVPVPANPYQNFVETSTSIAYTMQETPETHLAPGNYRLAAKHDYLANRYYFSDVFTVTYADVSVPHNHGWATEWTKDSTHHWHECTATGCAVTEDSQKAGYDTHTFDENGYCTVCGALYKIYNI